MPTMFSQKRVVANFFWNILGKGWAAFLMLLYVPYLVHNLGDEAYGIYATVMVLLSYFQFLEMGFGRALEKQSAANVGAGDVEQVKEDFATAFWLQFLVGAVGAVVIWFVGPLAVGLLKISPENQPAAVEAIHIAALSFGLSISSNTPAGLIRSFQRFNVLNGIDMGSQSLLAILSVLVVVWGLGLRGLMGSLLIKSVISFSLLVFYSWRLLGGKVWFKFNKQSFRKLFRFGGFLTISGLLAPVLVNVEKLMMGALISVGALTYYIVPYNAVDRVRLLPASLSTALFPYLSVLEGQGARKSMYEVGFRATEILAWTVLPLFAFIWLAGDELMGTWMGADFAAQAGLVLKILAAGFFINMLARNALDVIHACGNTELLVAFYVVEIILYVPLAYLLMREWGIVGAALAWTSRVAIDTVLMWLFASYLALGRFAVLPPFRWKAVLIAAGLVTVGLVVSNQVVSAWEVYGVSLLVALLLAGVGWLLVIDVSPLEIAKSLLSRKTAVQTSGQG